MHYLMASIKSKMIGLRRLLRLWWNGIHLDGPYWGYLAAARWHFIPIISQARHYIGVNRAVAPVKLRLFGYKHPIWLRPATSDYAAYRQIFRDREYEKIEAMGNANFILDCGANIGLASVFFLNHFIGARVLAVEPDPENAALCRQNLEKYGSRASVVDGGVWSHATELVVVPSEFGAGNKWGVTVRPRHPLDVEYVAVKGFDISSLCQRAGEKQIDLLKIDIEGSEFEVFRKWPERWLDRVRNIVIELHGSDCSGAFFSALAPYEYELSHRGDLTYCFNLRRRLP
jgi:FkbM family methyltransferase